MGNLIFKEAEMEDCYAIAVLKGEIWNTTYKGIYSDETLNNYDVERNKQTFKKIVANPAIYLCVAMNDEKIVGFMSCGEPYRPYLHYKQEIGLLYILKEYQNQGIGKKLFTIAKEIIQNNGYNEFFVSCNKYNSKALEFYKKMGGVIIYIDEDKEDKRSAQVKFHNEI